MYYGKMTPELEELLSDYKDRFGYDASGELGVEYGDSTYNLYLSDLKRSIETGVDIASLYPDDEDEW